MVRHAAYLYTIDTDETQRNLLKKILAFADAHKINLRGERPWRGFRLGVDNKLLYRMVNEEVFVASYGYEIELLHTLFNNEEEKIFLPRTIPLVIDVKRKILAIGTSSYNLASAIFSLLQQGVTDEEYIILNSVRFGGEFIKWLVNNATNNSSGMFTRMSGVKVTKLTDYDQNLNDAILYGDDKIGKSTIYKRIRNKGLHKYVIGYASIDPQTVYKVRIYDHGQMTLTGTGDHAPYLTRIGYELLTLFNTFNK